jgi:uncharacterized protein (TIGR03437 family)
MKLLLACVAALGVTGARAADPAVRPAFNFSKTFGGSSDDTANAVAVDASGNVYVAGITTSTDFPVAGAVQANLRGITLRASTDNGKTFLSPSIPDPVFAAAASAKAPTVVYAGTTVEMYKSTDSGKTFIPLRGFGTALVNALVADQQTAGVVYAGTDRGVMKTTDAGTTWKKTDSGQFVLALANHPSRPGTVIAAVALDTGPDTPSLYRTTDGGGTWTLLKNSPPGPYAVAIDTANPDLIYVAASTVGFSAGGTTNVYKSVDGGDNWTKLAGAAPAVSTFAIAAGSGTVFAETPDGLVVSRDGGASWKTTTVGGFAGANVAVDPTRPDTVYADGDGVFVSTDAGATWSAVSTARSVVETIAVVPTSPATVMIGGGFGQNLFVTKWSGDGKQMLYSTYLGSSYFDFVSGIAVDKQGNAYITGFTYGTDFPVTAGALQPKNAGRHTAFLSKISADGKTLLYSTYLGGSKQDAAFAVAVDGTGNAYLTGYAGSADFPVTNGAAQTKLLQNCVVTSNAPVPTAGDAFVAKIATDGTGLRYATLLGGTCADEGLGIAVDTTGSAYVAGATTSLDFPATQGAYQTKPGGGLIAGFLAKLNPQGTGVQYATYLGGKGADTAWSVALDASGAAYVTGTTQGFEQLTYLPGPVFFTFDPNAPQVGFAAALGGAAFVLKLDAAGAKREWVKYLGGTWGRASSAALDSSGALWTSGTAYAGIWSEPFPTLHPFQALGGSGFVSKLAADGTLLFSSMLDAATQVALDGAGDAFVAGSVPDAAKDFAFSPELVRIDGAAPGALTLETPQRIVAPPSSDLDVGVAAGEIAVLTGTGLGPAQEVAAQLNTAGRLTTTLGGTTVTFDDVPAPLISVGAQKVVCVVPFAAAHRSATSVKVHSGAADSNAILLPTAFTAVEALAAVNADGTANSAQRPAASGSVMTIYAAGLGETTPASTDGQVNGTAARTQQVTGIGVKVGTQNAQVLFIGPAPGQVSGITQINVQLPPLSPGSYQAAVGWGTAFNGRPFGADYGTIAIVVGPAQ